MAERMVLVCDVCGVAAKETVRFSAGGRNLQKDLCAQHLAELTAGARTPRRGRRPGAAAAAAVSAAAPKARRARSSKKATSKSTRRRRTRASSPGAQAAS